MNRKLIALISAVVFVSITQVIPAGAATKDTNHWKTLPPDLTTDYLQGHYEHKDPKHPNATNYTHRDVNTADASHTQKFNGSVETIKAGELCDFKVKLEETGTIRSWWWFSEAGPPVHQVNNPDLRSKYSTNGKSFWTIDEGWDFLWENPDGTVFIEGTATHMWVHDDRNKFRMYGTWHLLDGPNGLEYVKLFKDKTSIWDGTIDDIQKKTCEFLAP